MASQTVFGDLHFDAVVVIGKYLSPSDLNNCCAVSHAWHHTFSQNPFWKKHCNKDVVTYLKSTPCGTFDVKTGIEQSTVVARMSEWRVNFIYQNQLRKNWIGGNFFERTLTDLGTDVYLDDTRFELYNTSFLFIITRSHIRVYNISGYVNNFITEVSYNLSSFNNNTHFFHKVSNDKFVVSQHNFVKVFDISLILEWPVSFAFVFDKTEKESIAAIENQNSFNHMSPEISLPKVIVVMTGDFYVGIVTSTGLFNTILMHIWNIRTQQKLKVERVPLVTSKHVEIVCMRNSETPSDNLLVECSIRGTDDGGVMLDLHYFVYNLTTLKFYPLRLNPSGSEIRAILDDYLYVMSGEGLTLYDYNKRCHAFRWYPYTGNTIMNIVGDNVISLISDEDMTVLRLNSGDVHIFEGNWNIHRCCNLWDKFVIFDYISYNFTSMWYLRNWPKRLLDSVGQYITFDKFCTRLLLKKGFHLSLLTFW